MYWLLREDVLQTIAHARKTYVATVQQITAFEEMFTPAAEGLPRNLKIAGDVAEIRVEGVLSKKPDFWSWYFGGGNTTYEQIQQALAICEADATVKRVLFHVDSPGGNVDGLFDALASIDAFSKPKSVRAAYACSAAYAIAALGGKIEATNAAVQVGSIGVAVRYVDYDGVDVIDITSTEAPDKRPDPTTEAGRATIRETLDAIHDLFADAIAHGRGQSKATVNEKFGRGAVLLAAEAKKRGMIDRIAKPALRAITPSESPEEPEDEEPAARKQGIAQPRKTNMTEEELRAQHPELHKAVCGKVLTEERDRVGAHLAAAEASGDMKTAVAAIKSGDPMTQTMMTTHMMAGITRAKQGANQADSNAAGAVLDNAATPPANAGKDMGDQVADLLAAERGKK